MFWFKKKRKKIEVSKEEVDEFYESIFSEEHMNKIDSIREVLLEENRIELESVKKEIEIMRIDKLNIKLT